MTFPTFPGRIIHGLGFDTDIPGYETSYPDAKPAALACFVRSPLDLAGVDKALALCKSLGVRCNLGMPFGENGSGLDAEIAAGKHDAALGALLSKLNDSGVEIDLRLDPEFNTLAKKRTRYREAFERISNLSWPNIKNTRLVACALSGPGCAPISTAAEIKRWMPDPKRVDAYGIDVFEPSGFADKTALTIPRLAKQCGIPWGIYETAAVHTEGLTLDQKLTKWWSKLAMYLSRVGLPESLYFISNKAPITGGGDCRLHGATAGADFKAWFGGHVGSKLFVNRPEYKKAVQL